jgi:hypothetical protein
MSPRLSFSEWRGPLHEACGRLSGAFTKLEGDLSTRKLAQGDTWLERGHAAPIGVILVAYGPPSPTKLRGRTLSQPPALSGPRAYDPHGKGRKPRPLV